MPDMPRDIHDGVMQHIRAEGRVRVDQPDSKPIWQSRTAVALATGAVAMLLLVVQPVQEDPLLMHDIESNHCDVRA